MARSKQVKPELRRLTTFFGEDDELYWYVLAQAQERRVSRADIVREALQEWHERQHRARAEREREQQKGE